MMLAWSGLAWACPWQAQGPVEPTATTVTVTVSGQTWDVKSREDRAHFLEILRYCDEDAAHWGEPQEQ
jgi:hypothetical protein